MEGTRSDKVGRVGRWLQMSMYSFGMCIVEAVKEGLSWGNYPDTAIKYKILLCKELLTRRKQVDDAMW